MYRKFLLYIVLALVCVACSTDDMLGEGGKEGGKVTFSLFASKANTGTLVGDAEECELIKWYRVVITKPGSQQIVRCIDNTLGSAVEKDQLEEIQITPGTYSVYAFANIDFDYLNDLGIKEGGTIPANINTLTYRVPHHFAATPDADGNPQGQLVSAEDFADAGEYIPMTGLAPQTIEASTRVSQTYNIEVRRLFAKLEFVFTNKTTSDIQVNGLSVGGMNYNAQAAGNILLMNYEEQRHQLNYTVPEKPATLSFAFGTPEVLSKDGPAVSHSFYVLESRADNATNTFPLSFNITKKGVSPSATEDAVRYALTDPNTITLIHRNDWIVLPITLTDWQMRLEGLSYPPIGGYAEADIAENDQQDFLVTFYGPGDFVIRPFVRRYYDAADWFGLDDKTRIEGDPVIEVDNTSKLFNKVPRLTKSGEILGTMNQAPGKVASLTVSLNVKVSASLTQTIKRKIYVTQK